MFKGKKLRSGGLEVCANRLPSTLLPPPSLPPLSLPLPSFSRSLVSAVDVAEALAEGLVCLCVRVCGLTMEEEVIAGSS